MLQGGHAIDQLRLTAAALAGISLLLFLVVRSKLHAFVALLLVSVAVGVGAGLPLEGVLESMTVGMGSTLGAIAILVGLGAMFGRMLEASGGAEVLARALLFRFGEKRAQWALGLTGFLVAIPVFFDVGFVILVPTVFGLARKSRRPVVSYGIPLLAGLAVAHAFIPPTPGPIAVAGLLGAEPGWVILFGAAAGLPAMVVAGPVFARFAARWVPSGVPEYLSVAPTDTENDTTNGVRPPLPSVCLVAGLTAIPLTLIVAGSVAKAVLAPSHPLQAGLIFAGHPFVALLLTTLLSFYLLGTRRGLSRDQVQAIASAALQPAGLIILVTGAGGVLKQVLIDSGVGRLLAETLRDSALPPILAAFVVAALLRLVQGSATVAMMSAAGLVAALIEGQGLSQPMLALLVVAIAAGATTTSHVNDSGFWLVNRYFGLSVPDTLRTWTLATTLIAVVGLAIALGLGMIVA